MTTQQLFMNLVSNGETDGLKEMIRDGAANLNELDPNGDTPLMVAVNRGHIEVVETLIELDANVNIANMMGWTALIYACRNGNVAIASTLILNGNVNVNHADTRQMTALMYACNDGHLNVVSTLIREGNVDVNQTDHIGWTALMHAVDVCHGYMELRCNDCQVVGSDPGNCTSIAIIRILISFGANVNHFSHNRTTPLIMTAWKGCDAVLMILIVKGANIDFIDSDDHTALYYANEYAPEKTCNLLRFFNL